MLERFANHQFQDFAVETKLISEKQSAYQKCSSCNTALMRLVDEWKWSIDIKQIAVAAFHDLRKAFDVRSWNLQVCPVLCFIGLKATSIIVDNI